MASTNVASVRFTTFRKLKSLIQRNPVNIAKKLNHSSENTLKLAVSNPKQTADITIDTTSTIVHGVRKFIRKTRQEHMSVENTSPMRRHKKYKVLIKNKLCKSN